MMGFEQSRGPRNDRRDLDLAWANLMQTFDDEETPGIFALQILRETVEECKRNDVNVNALVTYWQDFEDWKCELDQRHLAECMDGECDAAVCRAARGLEPLTAKEARKKTTNHKRSRTTATVSVPPTPPPPNRSAGTRSKPAKKAAKTTPKKQNTGIWEPVL